MKGLDKMKSKYFKACVNGKFSETKIVMWSMNCLDKCLCSVRLKMLPLYVTFLKGD